MPTMDTEVAAVEQQLDRAAATGQITQKFKMKWEIFLPIALLHLALVFAPATFNWRAFWVFMILQVATGMGITVCYHRLLTHRSFRVPKWLEYALTLFGNLALQGGPLKWVATHRVHHAFSDRPQDPHSPNRGFGWAHMFWLFAYDELTDNEEKFMRFVPELARDPVHMLMERTMVLQQLALAGVLYALGGWSWVVWGIVVRVVFVWHGTWLVNSAAHIWGYRTYKTGENSTNNWWVALVSYGEGWHNNHHAYPYSAAHGLKWWELDLTYVTIKALSYVGLISDIRLPRGNPAKLMFPPEVPRAERLASAFPNVTALQPKATP